jgi:hypothetical protein
VSELQFACQAKYVEGDERSSSPLGRSRRVRLRVYDDVLEFDGKRIAYESIDEAVLISIRQLFIPSFVLRIECAGRTVRFGVNSDAFWRGDLPLPVRRVRGRVRLNPLSKVLRVALLLALIWYAWKRLS